MYMIAQQCKQVSIGKEKPHILYQLIYSGLYIICFQEVGVHRSFDQVSNFSVFVSSCFWYFT